jgi:SAM-dependent methyltransferase
MRSVTVFFKQGIWSVAVNYFGERSISYFVRNNFGLAIKSIKEEGFKRLILIILNFLGDFYFDFKYGTNTMTRVYLHDLEIQSDNKSKGYKYVPTKARSFKQLMNKLDFPDNCVFVDFGSGKGRVLILASQFGFNKVIGIEFSPKLCAEARKNISIYKKKAGAAPNIQIIESDVVDYQINDNDNVFFLYNPFNRVIMDIVLTNIISSLRNRQRKIWLIYNHPIYQENIEIHDTFIKLKRYVLGGDEYIVYVNRFGNQ